MDFCVRARNRARAVGPAWPSSSATQSSFGTHTIGWGLGNDNGVKNERIQPQCGAHGGGFLSTASSCCNLARPVTNGAVNWNGGEAQHATSDATSTVIINYLLFFKYKDMEDSRLFE
jgi:hypothetical protein